jgi:flagellar basal body-associated protein FliL
MSQPKRNTRRFAGHVLLSLLVTAAIFLLMVKGRIDITFLSIKRTLESRQEVNHAKCVLELSAGDQNLLLKFLIPCSDQRQWDEVTSKMVRVKHECLMALHRPDATEFIRQRNFEALRKVLVRTLNGVLSQQVGTIFFENVTSH